MEPIPLPSHIHYELLLQLLERQTMFSINSDPAIQDDVHQLVITLRKALSQQKRLEERCRRSKVPFEYRWSLNRLEPDHDLVSEVAHISVRNKESG